MSSHIHKPWNFWIRFSNYGSCALSSAIWMNSLSSTKSSSSCPDALYLHIYVTAWTRRHMVDTDGGIDPSALDLITEKRAVQTGHTDMDLLWSEKALNEGFTVPLGSKRGLGHRWSLVHLTVDRWQPWYGDMEQQSSKQYSVRTWKAFCGGTRFFFKHKYI